MGNIVSFDSIVGIDPGTIGFTLINTLIICCAYYFLLHKPVTKMFEARNEKINSDIEEAASAKEKARVIEAEYIDKLHNSKEEAREIVARAVKNGQEQENLIVSQAQDAALQIQKKADADVELAISKAKNDVKNQIADLVILAAQAVSEKEISKQDNELIIEKFLTKI